MQKQTQFPTTPDDPDLKYYKLAAERDGKYPIAAICYVSKCLSRLLLKNAAETGARQTSHVTGQAVCEALRESLLDDYGVFAQDVLARWNIRETNDFGNIIYLLIDVGMLSASEKDSRSDFVDVFDFTKAFKVPIEGEKCNAPWPVLD